jgi:phenylpropionate dioxygenase-like ring-hydroxylating dioxygenase large terminal subunit
MPIHDCLPTIAAADFRARLSRTTRMTYLRNAWYMAGWADEVSGGAMLARRLLDTPVLLFRDEAGAARAIFDRCPHRFVPLSKGRVERGAVFCGYHGLGFDGSGVCIRNPHGPIVQSMRIQTYPVREAFRALWIWMGDPARAEATPLVNLSIVDRMPDTAFSKGYIAGNGGYQLFVDNILDLTHADYLHPDTLGGGSFTRTRAKIFERDDSIGAHWHCMNEVPTPVQEAMFGSGTKVDSWTEVDWYTPSILTLRSGAVPAGTPREAGGNVTNLHIMTPETSRSTHYFFASTRDFAMNDAELNERFAAWRARIFLTEDKPMIAAQQQRLGDHDLFDLDPILLRIDEGAVRVRRRLAAMIAAEQAASQAP